MGCFPLPTSKVEMMYGQKLAEAMGLAPRFGGVFDQGGASNISMIAIAAMAIEAGQAQLRTLGHCRQGDGSNGRLFHPRRSFRSAAFCAGQEVEVGIYETMVTFLMSEHLGGHLVDLPIGPPLYERAVSSFRRPYRTSDGAVAVNIYTDGHFGAFARLVGDESWADDPRYAKLSDRWANLEFSRQVEGHMSKKPSSYWMAAFDKTCLPFAAVQSLEELHKESHLQAVGFFKSMETSERSVRSPGILGWFSRTPAGIREPASRPGAHSADILKDLASTTIQSKPTRVVVSRNDPPSRCAMS
jgi:hypothetical protein